MTDKPGWQPIETAPKDGTEVLLWPIQHKGRKIVRSGYWHQPANPDAKGFWVCGSHTNRRPVFWQPTPEPPA